jgi:hypothetical protein
MKNTWKSWEGVNPANAARPSPEYALARENAMRGAADSALRAAGGPVGTIQRPTGALTHNRK